MSSEPSAASARARQAAQSAAWTRRARRWHLYLGTLFAPTIIFFAFSGSLQLFNLHESHPGDSYQAPAWIQKMASIHKDQRLEEKHGPPPAPAPGQIGSRAEPGAQPQHGPDEGRREPEHRGGIYTLALKWFFLGAALGLVVSTVLGIYMAFQFGRSRRLVWGLLFAGTVIPAVLIALMS